MTAMREFKQRLHEELDRRLQHEYPMSAPELRPSVKRRTNNPRLKFQDSSPSMAKHPPSNDFTVNRLIRDISDIRKQLFLASTGMNNTQSSLVVEGDTVRDQIERLLEEVDNNKKLIREANDHMSNLMLRLQRDNMMLRQTSPEKRGDFRLSSSDFNVPDQIDFNDRDMMERTVSQYYALKRSHEGLKSRYASDREQWHKTHKDLLDELDRVREELRVSDSSLAQSSLRYRDLMEAQRLENSCLKEDLRVAQQKLRQLQQETGQPLTPLTKSSALGRQGLQPIDEMVEPISASRASALEANPPASYRDLDNVPHRDTDRLKSDQMNSDPRSDRFNSDPRSDKFNSDPRSDKFNSDPRSDKFNSDPRADRNDPYAGVDRYPPSGLEDEKGGEQLQTTRDRLRARTLELNKTMENLAERERECDEIRKALEEENRQRNELKERLQRERDAKQKAQMELDELKRNVDEKSMETRTKEEENEELKKRLKELEHHEKEERKAKKDMAKFKREKDLLKEKLRELKSLMEEGINSYESVEKEVDTILLI